MNTVAGYFKRKKNQFCIVEYEFGLICYEISFYSSHKSDSQRLWLMITVYLFPRLNVHYDNELINVNNQSYKIINILIISVLSIVFYDLSFYFINVMPIIINYNFNFYLLLRLKFNTKYSRSNMFKRCVISVITNTQDPFI